MLVRSRSLVLTGSEPLARQLRRLPGRGKLPRLRRQPLEEFGLLTIDDPMPSRRRGRWNPPLAGDEDVESSLAPLPYRFVYAGDIPDTDAWTVITQSLDRSALPSGLNDFADLLH